MAELLLIYLKLFKVTMSKTIFCDKINEKILVIVQPLIYYVNERLFYHIDYKVTLNI